MAGHRHGFLRAAGCFATALSVVFFASLSLGKTDVPVFLFSGQSNMTGMGGAVSDLTAAQKDTVGNVKIYLESEGTAVKMKKWMTLGPGFGSDQSHFGPELFFGKTLSDSMPGKKIAFIKDARSGTYLAKADQWLPPSSNNGKGGAYYGLMMTHIATALKSFNSAFDTAQYTPRWAGFIWLQGEFDAEDQGYANAYETNLSNLIKDIRDTTNVVDLPIILPMIDVQSIWTYNSKVRAADVACKQKLKNVDTMDTKGLPTDGIHYKAAGQVKIGTVCAQRWLRMKFNYGPPVPIAYHYSQPSMTRQQPQIALLSPVTLFDPSGRKVRAINGAFENAVNRPPSHNGVFIATINQSGGTQGYKRTVVGK